MAKKSRSPQNNSPVSNSLDLSKGFSTSAFASLKSLQDIRKAEAEDRKLADAQKERERIEAAKAAQIAAKRERDIENATGHGAYARFTEEDLGDTSNMSDQEIFLASMAAMDGADLYQEKFNKKEKPVDKKKDEPVLTMTEEEREFAIFTQEMAITQVRRLDDRPGKKKKNRVPVQPVPQTLTPTFSAAPAETDNVMKTQYVAPTVTVTQSIKGNDVLDKSPEENPNDLTPVQKKYLKDINRYQERFGSVITLKLRGLALSAATQRLDDYLDACTRDKAPYGLIICGKGLGSLFEPVIKNMTISRLKADDRIVEYIPVINEDGDFGSLYVVFKK